MTIADPFGNRLVFLWRAVQASCGLWASKLSPDESIPEVADHLLQLAAQPRQFNARRCRLVTGGGGLLGHRARS
jgi:hypothetical protein